MHPNSMYFTLKVVRIWVLWALSIYYLGTWTLSERVSSINKDVQTLGVPRSHSSTGRQILAELVRHVIQLWDHVPM